MRNVVASHPAGLAGLDRFEQLPRLEAMLAEVLAKNAFWRERLAGHEIPRSAEEFRRLPLTSNRDLSADVVDHPPFGTNLTYSTESYCRYHQTSGTIGKPLPILDTEASWSWWCDCWDAVLDASAVSPGDRALFAFSFAPFIGFWSAYSAVARRGIFSVPAGGASTLRRLHLIRSLGCTVLFCTPTYALRLVERAERSGIDTASSTIRTLILAGEPGASIPATRSRLETAWGAEVFDHAGSSEVGAYGIPYGKGLGILVNEREFIAEVLEVGGTTPVEDGETGELVLTNLGRWGSPVIRYRTGDLVRPARIEEGLLLEGGGLGRIDHMMLVRGVNVHPVVIEEAVRRWAGTAEFRITVRRSGAMDEVDVEVEADPTTCRSIADDVRSAFGVRIAFASVPRESLPRWEAKSRRVRDLRA